MTNAKFPLPDKALEAHIAVLGKTGAGKTTTTKDIVEHVVPMGFRVCVLDTIKSDWWGITSSASGKSPGLPFKILGGPRGHVPLHSSAGGVIGQLVGRGQLPLSIVDMANFEAGGIQRFFVDFAEALWKNARGVVYLVIEEAHELAPKERAGFNAENMSIHWAKKLATGSRKKGIRLIVASQSVQQLHNRVLGSCETLIAHRLIAPADQDPIVKWMKSNAGKARADDVEASLSSLPTGTAWVCSGEAKVFERITFPKNKTFDNTATPTDDAADIDVRTAAVDQDELRTLIGEEVAKAEASNPEKLKERIADLAAKLSRAEYAVGVAQEAHAAPPDPAALGNARRDGRRGGLVDGHTAGFRDGWDARGNAVDRVIAAIGAGEELFARDLGTARTEFSRKNLAALVDVTAPAQASPAPARQALQAQQKPAAAPATNGASDRNQQVDRRVLGALAELEALGTSAPTRELVGAMAGFGNITSKGFRQAVAFLIGEGSIEMPRDGRLALTDAGRAIAPRAARPGTVADMRNRIVSVLGAPADRILDELIRIYPQSIERQALGDLTGFGNITSKGFRQSVARLIDMGFAANHEAGKVKATEALFP
jgi:hypothetical protein